MKRWGNAALCALLCISLAFGGISVFAAERPDAVMEDLRAVLIEKTPEPQVGAVGGEWVILGLARSGADVPDGYFEGYYRAVEDYTAAAGGVLHDKKYTEYSRVVLALTAIGKDPRDVAGYDILAPLGDYDKTIWQGNNGAAWALIALDSAGYAVPQNAAAQTRATREMYIARLLDCQLPDGGWSLLGGTASAAGNETSDPDMTGMVLQALSRYQEQPAVAQAIERAIACMSDMQLENGGYAGWGTESLESSVQMLVALCALGLLYDDARFVKNGAGLLDYILAHYQPGIGCVDAAGAYNQMATEQAYYALTAVKRQMAGMSGLYQMNDPASIGDIAETAGLPGKHADVQTVAVCAPGRTFADITGHAGQAAVEALAARGVINGMDETHFAPDNTMTRAEFAAVVVRALGLPPKDGAAFADVPADAWFAGVVGTAQAYGIITGISDTAFNPQGVITREQAAVMVARAAALCGLDVQMDSAMARNVLAGFSDYITVSDWAVPQLAFCYHAEILPDDALEILPQQAITRAEIAHMVYRLLGRARLL